MFVQIDRCIDDSQCANEMCHDVTVASFSIVYPLDLKTGPQIVSPPPLPGLKTYLRTSEGRPMRSAVNEVAIYDCFNSDKM